MDVLLQALYTYGYRPQCDALNENKTDIKYKSKSTILLIIINQTEWHSVNNICFYIFAKNT